MPETLTHQETVTVSIVSHGQWEMIAPLLDQLNRWCVDSIAKIVLTSNLAESINVRPHWKFPIERIENPQPRGFGANHNTAFRRCETEWFLILNPDIRLESDVVGTLLRCARKTDGVLAPRIREPGKSEPEPYRSTLTPFELISKRLRRHHPPPVPAWVAGMFMQTNSRMYRHVGGFDERYYMYCEDFDFCARIQLAGAHVRVIETQEVLHDARRASHINIRHLYWHISSLTKLWLSATFWKFICRKRRL